MDIRPGGGTVGIESQGKDRRQVSAEEAQQRKLAARRDLRVQLLETGLAELRSTKKVRDVYFRRCGVLFKSTKEAAKQKLAEQLKRETELSKQK